jgi:radical SAM superfamily enzyme YgiQ (UPF0313 family)
MKILLVSTKLSFGDSRWLPLGLAYISAVLKQNGFKDIYGIDTGYLKDWKDFEERIKKIEPDVVGISSPINGVARTRMATKIVKKNFPDTKIIFGGPHPSVSPQEAILEPHIDAIAMGEGEYTMLEVCERIQENDSLRRVKGIWYKENGEIIKNEPREPIKNLDELPLPDREIFDIETCLKKELMWPLPLPGLFTMASRGCYFKCSFCHPLTDRIYGGKGVRYRSPDNVIKELKILKKKYKIRSTLFEDDTFTVNRKWVLEFCKKLYHEDLDLSWWAHSRVNTLNREIVKAMRKAGCKVITFGVESGSARIRNGILNKNITKDEIREGIKLCKEEKVISQVGIMIGTPTETEEDIRETYRLLKETKPEIVWVSITTPYPGTPLYERVTKEGTLLLKSYEDFQRTTLEQIKLEYLTPEDLEKWRRRLTRLNFSFFFLNEPWYLKICLRRWFYMLIEQKKAMEIVREMTTSGIKDMFKIFACSSNPVLSKIGDKLLGIQIFHR